MKRRFYRLVVADVRPEIAAAKSVRFAVPTSLRNVFQWRPGQHITLRFTLNGEEVRRSYSISSSPYINDPLRITVKRFAGGLVSNHINDTIEAGSEIQVMPPFGGFILDPQPNGYRSHYFFAAGSGITPLFSMLTSVLAAEPRSAVNLLYGNRNATSILFCQQLEALQADYPQRLRVVHTLSSRSIWSSFDAWKGIIDDQAVARFIDAHPPYAQDAQYYICGPGGMNSTVRRALLDLDVPPERIHFENFGANKKTAAEVVEGVAAKATVSLDGTTTTVPIPEGKTVLTALLAAGLEVPYSCQSGVCSACRAHLQQGTVYMRARMALEDHEIAAGAILTCQSLPTTQDITIRYAED